MAAQAILYGGMAALDLAGSYFAAQNIKATAKLNREIAEMNAQFAELDAYDAKIEGYSNIAKYQETIDKTVSDQKTSLAAADIQTGYGTVGEIQNETKFIGELNKMEIEKQAQEQASGFTKQARNYRFGGDLNLIQAKSQASQVMVQGVMNAVNKGATGYMRSK